MQDITDVKTQKQQVTSSVTSSVTSHTHTHGGTEVAESEQDAASFTIRAQQRDGQEEKKKI